jgi:competence CoiA-like predicted nuclease
MKNTTIPFAINKSTNKKIFADEVLDKSEEDRRLIDYICYYCNEPLHSVVNKNNPKIQSWFRHENNSDCALQSYSKKDTLLDVEYIRNIESERHKLLKKYLRIYLYKQGVEKVVEEKIIFDNNFFYRRPDIYCEYQNKKIAFEIQVSKLSYKSLKKRSNFFKENGIYCIWIVDWFVPNLTQGDYDFKEHNPFENVFTINLPYESKFSFYLNYIEPSSRKDKWRKKIINNLDELKFDKESYQVYFYNTPLFRKKITELFIEKMKDREEEEKKLNQYNKKREQEKEIATQYLNEIKSMNIDNEIEFINNLEYDCSKFSSEIQKYFFLEIKDYSDTYRYDYGKPFLNNLIYYKYGIIVEFLLSKSPMRLYVDGKDELGISIWQQLVGCCYGFANDGYIDLDTLVPLINNHTKVKKYRVEEVRALW